MTRKNENLEERILALEGKIKAQKKKEENAI